MLLFDDILLVFLRGSEVSYWSSSHYLTIYVYASGCPHMVIAVTEQQVMISDRQNKTKS